jgi:hypothetical protein
VRSSRRSEKTHGYVRRAVFLTRFLTETPRDGAGGQGFREPVKSIGAGELRRIGCVGTQGLWPCVLITRRSQVQILPPLPTRQRYYRRSTARKLSLRAVFMYGGGVRSDQITGHNRLG